MMTMRIAIGAGASSLINGWDNAEMASLDYVRVKLYIFCQAIGTKRHCFSNLLGKTSSSFIF